MTQRWAALALAGILLIATDARSQCMLANPSFELAGSGGAAFAGWNAFGSVARVTGAPHGAATARVTGSSADWGVAGVWQRLDCEPGERWKASVLVSPSTASPLTGASRAILNIEWRDGAGNLISYESHAAADPSTPAGAWRRFEVLSEPAPGGTAAIHFLLGVLHGPGDPLPQVFFDAATCANQGPPTPESLQWMDFPSGRTVSFGGRTWRVKGTGWYGPGPNRFDSGSGAVWVDGDDRLHLTIRQVGGAWYSSEVALTDALGYGDYVFTTVGRLDLLDRNAVLGLFLWEYGPCWDESLLWWNPHNEIDVEFSRWGSPSNPIGQFVAQPATGASKYRFGASFTEGELSSHAMRWLPNRVEFRSWRGGPEEESDATRIASWTYTGPYLPRPEAPRVHMNLWQLAAPAAAQEVVLDAFDFRPCPEGDCNALVAAPVSSPAIRVAAAPNPLVSGTTLRWSAARAGHADLAILDPAGRLVRRLVSGTIAAGAHATRWDGRDDQGARVAPGVYLYRLRAAGVGATGRLVVLQ